MAALFMHWSEFHHVKGSSMIYSLQVDAVLGIPVVQAVLWLAARVHKLQTWHEANIDMCEADTCVEEDSEVLLVSVHKGCSGDWYKHGTVVSLLKDLQGCLC